MGPYRDVPIPAMPFAPSVLWVAVKWLTEPSARCPVPGVSPDSGLAAVTLQLTDLLQTIRKLDPAQIAAASELSAGNGVFVPRE